jgi:serine protease Do
VQAPPQAVALPSLAPLVESVKAAVVNVDVTSRIERDEGSDDPFEQFFGRGRRDPRGNVRQGAGSGFVIDPRGYILTNNHVVEGAFNIKVRFADGRAMEAEVLGRDPPTDIARQAQVPRPTSRCSGSVTRRGEVGDWVVAIGNPFGWPPASARASSAPRPGRSVPRPTTTSSRPTRRSIPGTPVAHCSTSRAR